MINEKQIYTLLTEQLMSKIQVVPIDGRVKIVLPFDDASGDPVEILATPEGKGLRFDDLGHTASLLFHLGQHREETPGYMLVRNLADAYAITMNYDEGVLSLDINENYEEPQILDFIKVLVAVQTVIPEIKRRKRERKGNKRLDVKLRREITPLGIREYVQRQQEVNGKYEFWTVDYRYSRKSYDQPSDVLLVVADLRGQEPRLKAEHVLTLAHDILDEDRHRSLRIVYDANGNGVRPAAQRACAMIDAYKNKIGYQAFNYANLEDKQQLSDITYRELSSFTLNSGR